MQPTPCLGALDSSTECTSDAARVKPETIAKRSLVWGAKDRALNPENALSETHEGVDIKVTESSTGFMEKDLTQRVDLESKGELEMIRKGLADLEHRLVEKANGVDPLSMGAALAVVKRGLAALERQEINVGGMKACK